MADAVLVVDMLRGFCQEGNPLYCGPTARQIIPNVQKLLDKELSRGSKVIFLIDTHDPDDKEFQMFPVHCVRGTSECDIIPELSTYPAERLEKSRYSGFYGTDLSDRLKKLNPDRISVCGVCTDICVLHTVADARNRDYPVVVYKNCVATFDDTAHKFALDHIEKILGAQLVTVE